VVLLANWSSKSKYEEITVRIQIQTDGLNCGQVLILSYLNRKSVLIFSCVYSGLVLIFSCVYSGLVLIFSCVYSGLVLIFSFNSDQSL